MLHKPDSRYDSITVASRIETMSELIGKKYSSLRESMSVHVDTTAALIKQLLSMATTFDHTLAVGMLVSSVDVSELAPVSAYIKKLIADSLSWEYFSNRPIKVVKTINSGHSSANRAAAASAKQLECLICHKSSNLTEDCFPNPLRKKKCKLNVTNDAVSSILGSKGCSNRRSRPAETIDLASRNQKTLCYDSKKPAK